MVDVTAIEKMAREDKEFLVGQNELLDDGGSMSLWGRIFGTERVINAGISGIDKAFYTKEEQVDNDLTRIGVKLAFLKTYEGFKIAQRFLALIVGIPFVSIHLISAVLWLSSIFLVEDATRLAFIVGQLKLVAESNNLTLGEPFIWIVIFYFGGGAAEGAINKFRGIYSKSKDRK